jgi:AraC family transcriptional regulator of adaptative response/methylated-DNA-[protein]-cysteine methyltransferase
VHLSPFHFQRLFSRWAGVTPKRFLQVLTLEHVKELLARDGLSVLDASHAAGLSGGSRVYDHFVSIEADTPSEYRGGGAGLTIAYGVHATPFGPAAIATTPRGICRLAFVADGAPTAFLAALRRDWPQAAIREDARGTGAVMRAVFDTPAADRPLSLWVRGTNFQVQVWRALLAIPPGQLGTYGAVAAQLGRPTAARAVGTAVGANPVACLIPCHRVIRRDGALGGYRWGPHRKHAILTRELARSE